jgi:Phosphotransferase enzyme family
MQTRPADLPDAVIAAAVSDGWKLPAATAAYRPVGYGSHHWSVDDAAGGRWFASVDVLAEGDEDASFDRLATALTMAAAVRDTGLSFVVAPVRAPDGSVLRRLPGGYALAVYPYVAGRSGGFHDPLAPADAAELIGMVCSLHAASVGATPGVETFAIPGRDRLESALAETGDGWPGLYGPRLRALLAVHADEVDRALREHDRLVAGPQTDRLVLTHGEPHPGNLIHTADGLALIDWDTALLAPPERDVWLLDARTDGRASAEYAARSGRPLDLALLARYRLAWSLADLAVFVELLRYAPGETADTAWSWEAFEATLTDLPALSHRHWCGS